MRRVLLLAAGLIVVLVVACFSLERDAARSYHWQKRGQVAGDLARQYCEQASQIERGQFLYGFYGQAGRNIWVSVRCGDEPATETPAATGPPPVAPEPSVPGAPAPTAPPKPPPKK